MPGGLSEHNLLMEYYIVNYKDLSRILCASEHTLKKTWRSIPHFFIGEGHNLKGARFNVPDVIEYLKKGGNYGNLERSEKKSLGIEVSVSEKAIQKRGLSNTVGRINMGSEKARRTKKSVTSETDPFNLLAGVNNVP